MKLTIELVPSTSWWDNLRKKMPRSDWDVLRKRVYARQEHKCGVCGASGRLNCHEVWAYDDKMWVQTLVGFIALCDLCHHVKHIGLAKVLADAGRLDWDSVVSHFCSVNGCDLGGFCVYEVGVWDVWRKRSKHDWTVDLGEYAYLNKLEEVSMQPPVGDEYDGYWMWIERKHDVGGIYYYDYLEYDEYLIHYGKFCIFGAATFLGSLAESLREYVICGVVPELKYNRVPSGGETNCVMCVYCDDRNKVSVRRVLESVGVFEPVWKYERDTLDDWQPRGRLFNRAADRDPHWATMRTKSEELFDLVGFSFDPLNDWEVSGMLSSLGLCAFGDIDRVDSILSGAGYPDRVPQIVTALVGYRLLAKGLK